WCCCILAAASRSSSSSKQDTTSDDMTSRTGVVLGSLPSAVARIVMSRSVSIPTRRSPSPIGSTPLSRSRILRAASRSVASGGATTGSRVMISWICIALSSLRASGSHRCDPGDNGPSSSSTLGRLPRARAAQIAPGDLGQMFFQPAGHGLLLAQDFPADARGLGVADLLGGPDQRAIHRDLEMLEGVAAERPLHDLVAHERAAERLQVADERRGAVLERRHGGAEALEAALEQLRLRPRLLQMLEDAATQVRVGLDALRLVLEDLDRLHLH